MGYKWEEIEKSFYKIWEERGYFEIESNKDFQKEGKVFSIMMPPPNVTGRLHIGHALTFTLQDIIVRYKRMEGYKTLWQPGTDHAGIATQNVVEKKLLKENTKKEEIGREEFLKKVWEWKEKSGGEIVKQLKALGISPAWSRERFTMDEGLKNAVRKAFIELYNQGYIYRGNYMVNWCTKDGALSDIEVEYKEKEGALYFIRYPFAKEDGYVVVATTRPETYLGDSAVMVNPNDERYKNLIGKKVKLPLIEREIEIIADEHVDMEFGTGAVKVTPAHDPNDYEIGLKHNLSFITIFDERGILNEEAGEFEGLERLKAREIIAKRLAENGFIEKIEPYTHQVGYCYRCDNIVEPYISKQWFVKKEIAKKAIEDVNRKKRFFIPPQWLNNFNGWMRDLRDWCISRQLWWGHQIPVWYCRECGYEWACEKDIEEACPKCNSKDIYQDPDVLDTWFSSALWPFSTLGWGNEGWMKGKKYQEKDIEEFYPNSLLITGFDILFFWVARMMMMGEFFLGKLPFKEVYLHALVRDKSGQKMSKSKGNAIDPTDAIKKYSADALRFTLAALSVQGRDIKLSDEKLELYRNFVNKLYNAGKYLLLNAKEFSDLEKIEIETTLGKYILSRFNKCVKTVKDELENYRFNNAATTIYRFLWGEFCDWGIELSKVQKDSLLEIGAVFKEALKLLHPFMPFITEFLYQKLSGTSLEKNSSVMVMKYPKADYENKELGEIFAYIIDSIVSLRRAKALLDIPNSEISQAFIKTKVNILPYKKYIEKLAKCENIEIVSKEIPEAVSDIGEKVEVFIPLKEIDLAPVLDRLNKQYAKLQKEFVKLNALLSNENFLKNAPEKVVKETEKNYNETNKKIEVVKEKLKRFSI